MKQTKLIAFFLLLLSIFVTWKSLTLHAAVLTSPGKIQTHSDLLDIGVFLIWPPAILAVRGIPRRHNATDQLNTMLNLCPFWMRAVFYILPIYAFVNIIYGLFVRYSIGAGEIFDYWHLRGKSAGMIGFYGLASIMFYAFLRSDD